MINNLPDIQPLNRVLIQATINKVYHTGIQTFPQPHIILIQTHRLVNDISQVRLLFNVEWIRANQKLIQHNTNRPDVYFLVVLLSRNELWAKV